jgi:hypothetical protein
MCKSLQTMVTWGQKASYTSTGILQTAAGLLLLRWHVHPQLNVINTHSMAYAAA